MMSGDLETRCAAEIRGLARQYCDGEFNKGEYRRRRRDLLQRCVAEDFAPVPEEPDDVELQTPSRAFSASSVPSRDWLPIIMLSVTLVVVIIMGFLIYTIY